MLENIEGVRQALIQSTSHSARTNGSKLRLKTESVHKILQPDLQFHPYEMCVVQSSTKGIMSSERTSLFACKCYFKIMINMIHMSDEAQFHYTGRVNRKNLHYWASDNPHIIHQKCLHSAHVSMKCAVS